jgi:hypothetical protein
VSWDYGDFAERIEESVAEQYAAEDECKRVGHVVTTPERLCDRCARYVIPDWTGGLR